MKELDYPFDSRYIIKKKKSLKKMKTSEEVVIRTSKLTLSSLALTQLVIYMSAMLEARRLVTPFAVSWNLLVIM